MYEKIGEKFLLEYSLDDVPLERLKEIIAMKDDDPALLMFTLLEKRNCRNLPLSYHNSKRLILIM